MVEFIGKDLESAGNQDIAFGNDNEQWMATAYALKARYLLHQLAVTEDKTALLTEVKSVISEYIEVIVSTANTATPIKNV